MNTKQLMAAAAILGVAAFAGLRLYKADSHEDHGHAHDHGSAHGHGDHGHEGEESPRGPHGGQIHADGDFAIELKLDEADGTPKFLAYPQLGGKPVSPAQVKLTVKLNRFGGKVDTIRFNASGEMLRGDKEVVEPHSFSVEIDAEHEGKAHHWHYDSFEARAMMDEKTAAEAGVKIEVAGPSTFKERARLQGRVEFHPTAKQAVPARFGGLVKELRVQLGDRVRSGDVVAVIESNGSLKAYEASASLPGTVIELRATAGEAVQDGGTLCVIADSSRMSVAIQIPPMALPKVAKGQIMTVSHLSGGDSESVLEWVSPTVDKVTQAAIGRAMLPNPDGLWLDGTAVTASLVVGQHAVPLAVKASAIQTMGRWQMVFLREGDIFQGMPVETGRVDGDWVEILSGIDSGAKYVSLNSFLIKADILKEGASHDH